MALLHKPKPIPRGKLLAWLGLTLVVILAALLRFANLDSIGYANHYYTAAITSLLQSWHNFFFAAAEPGGAVSVDKPPLGLWIQAASAYFLGVSGFSVVLPQVLAGILSVIVLYHLVQRRFGTVAGLLAALALALTPVAVATDRNNTMDSTLILTLLLAAWAFIKAAESGRLGYLLLGALLVGLGFNIKMLQAYLPLPAFYALYFLGSPAKMGRKIGQLALASVLLVVVSFSWAAAVDWIPAADRPYVGSSSDNSETSLIFGYNGVNRLLGMMGRGSPGGQPGGQQVAQGGNPPAGLPPRFPGGAAGDGPALRPQPDGNVFQPGTRPQGGPGRPDGGGGGFNIGQAGPWRLFIAPLSKEASWLLPLALFSLSVLALGTRLAWPLAPKHQALVLWGGWLLTAGVFFSIAKFFHEYYLSMLAPAIAALVGIGLAELWRLGEKHLRIGLALSLVAGAGTIAFQLLTAGSFTNDLWWLWLTIGILAAGAAALSLSYWTGKRSLHTRVGTVLVLAAMFITPGIWSLLTNLNSSANQSLPAAYSGHSGGPANQGSLQINQELLSYLQEHTQGMKYLMAVPSSMQGADYVIATGRPVLYLGGFNGQDNVLTVEQLQRMVEAGELRYIYWGGERGGPGGRSGSLSSWVISSCQALQGYQTTTRNFGAPDGTLAGNGFTTTPASPGGELQVELYDCGR